MTLPRRALWIFIAFWLGALWAAPLLALTNEEFLDLCAGDGARGDAAAIKKAVEGGADVNFKGPGGLTPLMVFAGTHTDRDWQVLPALDVLLTAGADLNAQSEEGGTALFYAARNKSGPRLVSTLIAAGADPNLGAAGGLTPLMLAAGTDPDPLIPALMLAAGADPTLTAQREGQVFTLREAAEKNPNPKVGRLIEAAMAKAGRHEEGLPLFAAPPESEPIRQQIKTLDAEIRSLPGFNQWPGWSGYLKWQIDLQALVETRQASFGLRPSEAWTTEYEAYLSRAKTEAPPTGESVGPAGDFPPARLVIQGRYPTDQGATPEIMALHNRRLIVTQVPGTAALAGYERAGGRELWRYQPSSLSGFHPVENFLLVASSWGGSFGEAAVLDPVTGRELLKLSALDNPNWTVDPGRRVLIVSTAHSLDVFDLKTRQHRSWSWYNLLETQAWEEAEAAAREEQNRLLAPYQVHRTEAGLLAPANARLFGLGAGVDPATLERAQRSLAGQGFQNMDVLGFNYKNMRPNFVLGPPCLEDCGPAELDTPLFLVNPDLNRIDYLRPDHDRTKTLTRRHLALITDQAGRASPLITFSPHGETLAVTDTAGRVHFFAARDQARYLGSLADTVLDQASGRRVLEARLTALLDDDLSGRPLASFSLGQGFRTPVTAEFSLADGRLVEAFIPRPQATAAVTSLAASHDHQVAVGLENGDLWLISPDGATDRLDVEGGRAWTALAFSGDGLILLAADPEGGLSLERDGHPGQKFKVDLKNIRHLALDEDGRYAWVAAEADPKGRPALALVDLSGQAPPVYRDVKGPVLSLAYHPEAKYAVAVIDAPPPAAGGPPPDLAIPETTRWTLGRADIVSFDRLGRTTEDGPGQYNPAKLFAGLSPDLTTFLYQEVHPARASVDLAREALNSRQVENFDSQGLVAGLGPAVYSPDRRLALLLEPGREPGGDPALYRNQGGAFHVYDLGTGRALTHSPRLGPGLTGGAFVGGSRVAVAGRDGTVRLWDLKPAQPVNFLTWVFFEDQAALTLDRDFRLNAPDSAQLEGLQWTTDALAGQSLALECFRRIYQTADLAAQTLAGRSLPPVPLVNDLDLFQHEVKITAITREPDQPNQVAVTVEISTPEGQAPQPARDLELLMDGRMAAGYAGGTDGLIPMADGRFQTTFRHLPLPADGRDRVVFSAYAFNRDRVRSKLAGAALKFKAAGAGQ